ncbi:YihY/virulence factor BrkB family protein [Halobaculum sp. CBA1158]|uniref:YihY/virulence factor BrkB family protein n=1 Tax=Halobaculum sp. CBA1158 TaxID=2904243 RepID=UPI001F35CEBA|nr:YihY/virulence factor BrkB family protein [Halobaculum sp. CBA1158]UIO98955.1 YihY/virulence factor BrkB family protein [Halobaculum sp. CBA1158]
MRVSGDDAIAGVRAVVARARNAGIGFLAAAVAYYALVSLVPLSALVALAVTAVAGETVADRAVATLGDALSPAGREAVRGVLTGVGGRARTTAVGAVVLSWGATRLFRGLDRAFARVYRTEERGGVPGHLRDAVLALASVLSAVTGVVAVELLVTADPVTGLVRALLRVALLVGLLSPAYYVLPDVRVGVRETLPGAAVAAVGWTALYVGFGRYVGASGGGALPGLLGAVVLVVTWLYVGSFLLIAGAVINAVLAGR